MHLLVTQYANTVFHERVVFEFFNYITVKWLRAQKKSHDLTIARIWRSGTLKKHEKIEF